MKRFSVVGCVLVCLLSVSPARAVLVFNLNMTGAKEPDNSGNLGVGDPDGSGIGTLTLDPDLDTVAWDIDYFNIDGTALTAMHIHGPGATPTTNVPPFIELPLSTNVTPSGTLTGLLDGGDIADIGTRIDSILANPSEFYINLHSTAFLPGAVRDNLTTPTQVEAIPEPVTPVLMTIAGVGLVMRRWRG